MIVSSGPFDFELDWNDIEKSPRTVVASGGEIIADAEFDAIISRYKLFPGEQRHIKAAVAVGDGGLDQFAVAIDGDFHTGGRNAVKYRERVLSVFPA